MCELLYPQDIPTVGHLTVTLALTLETPSIK